MKFALHGALIALACCGDPPPAEPVPVPPREPVWSEAFDTEEAGSLSGVWGSRPDDVFIVGGSEAGAEIYHYDGARWSLTHLENVPLLIWVYGFAADDVYAVGVGGTLLRYDGRAWTRIETGTNKPLWGIFGASPDDLWIVGGDPFEGEPIVIHYDGATIAAQDVPAEDNPVGAHALFKVWGIDGALYAVGQRGLILRYDDTLSAWRAVPAGALADEDFVSLWGTAADRIVAVGGRHGARIAVFDGASWQTQAPEALGGLNGIHMESADVAMVGGVGGFLGRFVLGSGAVAREGEGLTHLDIHSVWGDGDGRHYAVGGTFGEPHDGVALMRSE